MKSVTGKEFAKVLERNGWKLLRIHGSHHIFGKAGSKLRISVPIHAGKALNAGVLRRLLSMTGLHEKDL
jgi:predicted RNA binding protein YcfA (HicA-like mRNA interferase family)